MTLDDLNKKQRWYVQGFVTLYQWNNDGLALITASLTVLVFLYPALLVKSLVGDNVAIVFLLACYFITIKFIAFWIINPLCGLFILERAQRSYGPVTRQKILEWAFEQHGKEVEEPLNIAALARANGEHK